jgi:hypothetical protein
MVTLTTLVWCLQTEGNNPVVQGIKNGAMVELGEASTLDG